ncbi:MAG TPA: glycosyl hydrolase [Chthonomonadaceae bacterium]|nr:glycosyl hydrolase [Chthonomonadaceae bacterium]
MRTTASAVRLAVAMVGLIGLAGLTQGQERGDALARGFQDPPSSARPRVWWHWMNGNVTKEGIKLDLEWMHRIGLGGFQNFDASLMTPVVVEKRLVYMTPEWRDAFRYAATLADQFGLEMAIAGSPGWSESGGPWVKPEQAMKKLVWSETYVEGGRPFTAALPKPPTTTGPFQNIPMAEFPFGPPAPPVQYYADSAVVAYRMPDIEIPMAELQPKVTSSGGNIDLAVLTDGDLVKSTALPKAPVGQQAWIQFEFAQPQTIHALTLAVKRSSNPLAQFLSPGESGQELQASDDGQQFRTVVKVPGGGVEQHTLAFPKVTARFFRVTFATLPPPPNPFAGLGIEGPRLPPPPDEHPITELILHTGARVHRFEEKAAFTTFPDLSGLPTPADADEAAIRKADVIDLTTKMRPDGTLDWTPPAGRWVVLRLGYSLTGHRNGPASPEATGLEVDKLNKGYVKSYFDTYLGNYQETVGPLMGKRGLQYVITDSWEAGVQNWTDDMIAEFTRRRGYDPRPWLPVLTGRVVESAEASDRFLWDLRKTLAELVAAYHYDQLTQMLHRRGMGRYSESHESGRAFIGDGMEVKRTADVPMSAMWTQAPGVYREQYGYNADIRESASVAHIYGQNLVAAESLTAGTGAWAWSPETLKPTADKELAMGLNRFVIHTSVHQPLLDKKPGLSLGPFGQWFTRNETWAEQAQPWISYLARCSYLLQQGHFVADVLYFYGEDSNITALFGDRSPDVPSGYNFDYINADALIHRLSVRDGRLATPSGMQYRVLALDPHSRQMSLPVLRKIRDMVEAGAVVVGAKPANTPSLRDDPAEFQAIADQLWGPDGSGRTYGQGKVYAGPSLAEALTAMQVTPDFAYTRPESDTNLLFVHRRLADGDLYFVDNRNNRREVVDATFRVQGKAAELWHADTGKREPASYRMEGEGTTVPLRLDPYETVFVVFRKPTTEPARTLPTPTETPLATVEGTWEVSFQPDRGAPAKITLDRLSSWSENADPGVKYFSGTGTYTKTVQAPADWFQPGARLWLDLGNVKNLAEVSVNGKPLGIVWKAPFRVDVTDALKPGDNTVSIAVTNLWVNRLIGDQQPGVTKKYTFTTQQFYRANSPLLPSGLLGPVTIVRSSTP